MTDHREAILAALRARPASPVYGQLKARGGGTFGAGNDYEFLPVLAPEQMDLVRQVQRGVEDEAVLQCGDVFFHVRYEAHPQSRTDENGIPWGYTVARTSVARASLPQKLAKVAGDVDAEAVLVDLDAEPEQRMVASTRNQLAHEDPRHIEAVESGEVHEAMIFTEEEGRRFVYLVTGDKGVLYWRRRQLTGPALGSGPSVQPASASVSASDRRSVAPRNKPKARGRGVDGMAASPAMATGREHRPRRIGMAAVSGFLFLLGVAGGAVGARLASPVGSDAVSSQGTVLRMAAFEDTVRKHRDAIVELGREGEAMKRELRTACRELPEACRENGDGLLECVEQKIEAAVARRIDQVIRERGLVDGSTIARLARQLAAIKRRDEGSRYETGLAGDLRHLGQRMTKLEARVQQDEGRYDEFLDKLNALTSRRR